MTLQCLTPASTLKIEDLMRSLVTQYSIVIVDTQYAAGSRVTDMAGSSWQTKTGRNIDKNTGKHLNYLLILKINAQKII